MIKYFFIILTFLINIQNIIAMDEKEKNEKSVAEKEKTEKASADSKDLESATTAQEGNPEKRVSCCSKIMNSLDPRSIIKAATYRVFAVSGTVGTAYVFTNDTQKSFSIGGVSSAIATCLYYIYDRIWQSECFNKGTDKCLKKCQCKKA